MDIDPIHLIAANDNDHAPVLAEGTLPGAASQPHREAGSVSSLLEDADASVAHRGAAGAPPGRHTEAPDPAPPICFKHERIARDPRMVELNEMADQAVAMTKDRLRQARMEPDEALEDLHLKQWGMAANTYAKLLTTIHKHRKFLLEKD